MLPKRAGVEVVKHQTIVEDEMSGAAKKSTQVMQCFYL
jgi:sialic acid synthase SpsE